LATFFNWKIDSLFVTAALTVLSFSVHDTIVIFDRIRENLRAAQGRNEPFDQIVNRSINETLGRSINTSLTIFLTLFSLLVLAGPVIRPLNAALLIGIVAGTYSSIFNAAPLVVDWERRFGRRGTAGRVIAAGRAGDLPTPRPAPTPQPAGAAAGRRRAPDPAAPPDPDDHGFDHQR
jgi:preprotein translocase subunit SecF